MKQVSTKKVVQRTTSFYDVVTSSGKELASNERVSTAVGRIYSHYSDRGLRASAIGSRRGGVGGKVIFTHPSTSETISMVPAD